jgi:hypothetical protein
MPLALIGVGFLFSETTHKSAAKKQQRLISLSQLSGLKIRRGRSDSGYSSG